MSLTGKLQDLSAIEILQILGLSKQTGVLTIESSAGRNNIVFKNGLILSASSPVGGGKNLGSLLVERHLLSPKRLEQLLELQKQRGNEPLGSILLEAGVIQENSLYEILKDRIREALQELKSITEGNFSFESTEVIPFDDLRIHPVETLSENDRPQRAPDANEQTPRPKPGRKTIPFQPAAIKPRTPSASEQPLSYEEIRHSESAETLRLIDLKVPETRDFPEVAFDLIAEQIEFPLTPVNSNLGLPVDVSNEQVISAGTILLVEDEALIRQFMANRMRENGYEVFQTESAREALRMVRQMIATRSHFSIITDLVMPTSTGSGFLGGLEFIEAVRKLDTRIPILVMTDYEDLRAQTRAYTLGVFDFHKKPIFSRSSVEETQSKMYHFTDMLLDALTHPPYALEGKKQEEPFWSDLNTGEKSNEQLRSASGMVRQISDLKKAFSDFSSGVKPVPEISHVILQYAADFFDRGLLLQVKKEEAAGVSGFGETGEIESMPQKVRRIRIDLNEESIFSKVLREKRSHVGKLTDTPANRQFISLIGRLVPPAIAMLPLVCRETVIGFLYADNALSRKPMKDLEALEILLAQAGLAMEHALGRRRITTIKFK